MSRHHNGLSSRAAVYIRFDGELRQPGNKGEAASPRPLSAIPRVAAAQPFGFVASAVPARGAGRRSSSRRRASRTPPASSRSRCPSRCRRSSRRPAARTGRSRSASSRRARAPSIGTGAVTPPSGKLRRQSVRPSFGSRPQRPFRPEDASRILRAGTVGALAVRGRVRGLLPEHELGHAGGLVVDPGARAVLGVERVDAARVRADEDDRARGDARRKPAWCRRRGSAGRRRSRTLLGLDAEVDRGPLLGAVFDRVRRDDAVRERRVDLVATERRTGVARDLHPGGGRAVLVPAQRRRCRRRSRRGCRWR